LDNHLSKNASYTYFRSRHTRCTPFAIESIVQPFNTSVSFGHESQITLNRSGDLVYWMYVVIDLPGIMAVERERGTGSQFPVFMDQACIPCSKYDEAAVADYVDDGFTDASSNDKAMKLKGAKDKWAREQYHEAPKLECCEDEDECPDNLCPEMNGIWAHYTNDIGQWLVQKAHIVIGGSTVDTLWSELMFCWEELSGKAGRRITEMCGKRYTRTQLICDSRQRRTLYVPLNFWFTCHSGASLPLSSLQFHGVQVWVHFAALEKSIVVSSPNVAVHNVSTGTGITANDLQAHIETAYVFLDNQERERFSHSSFETLVIQHQQFHLQTTNSQVRASLSFNHPCLELIWMVRRNCHEKANAWFNFSGLQNRDPVMKACLYLNNQARFQPKPGSWFRMIQPFQHHSNIPDTFVYVFSFALHPEDTVSPSGSCNFSRIDHVDLHLELQPGLAREQVTVLCYARNWNVLRFREGLGGLAYQS
jgi:hypothetical protein